MFQFSRDGERIIKSEAAVFEIFRTLKFNLQYDSERQRRQVVMVTSAMAQEGKTTNAVNLAIAFARSGVRVAAVDFNLRNPRLHQIFGMDNDYGLSSCLYEQTSLEDVIRTTRHSNLSVIPAGRTSLPISEESISARMEEWVDTLKASFEMVLIDSSPLLSSIDPYYVAPHCDGAVLVIRAGKTKRAAIQKAVTQLRKTRVHLIGAVLNRASPHEEVTYPVQNAFH